MEIRALSHDEQVALIQSIDMDALELEMAAMPQAETPTFHTFGPGVYFREAHFPAGAVILGHKHLKSTMNIVMKGDIAVVHDGGVSLLQAPFMFESVPGRKLAYALTDTVWINVIPTELTDVAEIENQFIEKMLPALEGPK
jgi:hypothetical protein